MRYLLATLLLALPIIAQARDDGRYASSPLKEWFDSLTSKSGSACCSNADGLRLDDPDWEFSGDYYRVRVWGDWYIVPKEAVVTEPNKVGYAVVWPVKSVTGTYIRCFLPGTSS